MKTKKKKAKIDNIGLEQLFGSKTRVKLLNLFFKNPERFYFVREATRAIDTQINSVRRELFNLKKLNIIKEIEYQPREDVSLKNKKNQKGKSRGRAKNIRSKENILKKYFQVNSDFILFPELRDLILKADFLMEKSFVRAIKKIGSVDYLALTGSFVGLTEMPVDLFLIGRFNRQKLAHLIKNFERNLEREINYTVMSRQEFRYRKDITDRFLYSVLENKKIVMVNNLGL